jgi:hypothetical protein
MMKLNTVFRALICWTILTAMRDSLLFAAPPDLTQGVKVDHKLTYNLGATGMRGWIYTKPETNLDAAQGRTTASSRQILVTHIGSHTPAEGVMRENDLILGTDGTLFSTDARKSLARAIQEAEKTGVLNLTRWRTGKTEQVKLKMRVLGRYSETAPFNCPKSKIIFDEACRSLEKEPLNDDIWGAVNGLALLSTGNYKYLAKVKELAYTIALPPPKRQLDNRMSVWEWGYKNLFLTEYFLRTGDTKVLSAIHKITVALAKGQSGYGTYGHGISELTASGALHGSIEPYGPVNSAGLIGNLAIVMGQKCGVHHPEILPAILRADNFFGYYVDKGAIPYGEHEPWPYHENNGKNSMAAVLFGAQRNKVKEARFFAKMATAAYANREYGHTGQGFSYLWGAMGANVGGPAATAAFFKEASWHLDLVRRCDGSFTYDGDEQYGPGETDDNTYYGKSSYYGLSPTACYVLTYSLPLKKLVITGREFKSENALSKKEVADAIASGRFDIDCQAKTPAELVAAFSDWSPVVRGWAAEELSKRPEATTMIPALIGLAEDKDVHIRQGACETLGLIHSADAIPVLIRQLDHDDRWVRFKAAQALGRLADTAQPVIRDILKAVVLTAEPLAPINWSDPIQLAQGQLAKALFSGPLVKDVENADRTLLYPAIRAISQNADGMARATLGDFIQNRLSREDIEALAPDILSAIRSLSPADTMFGNAIRMGCFKALTKYHYEEAIDAGVHFALTQRGHGSQVRTGEIMEELAGYGTAARKAVPQLRKLIVLLNEQCRRGEFPDDLNVRRVEDVKKAIKTIESATTQPELRHISTSFSEMSK